MQMAKYTDNYKPHVIGIEAQTLRTLGVEVRSPG